MINEFDKCKFCRNYDEYERCMQCNIDKDECFEPNKTKIIAVAKEEGINVTDLIALINL